LFFPDPVAGYSAEGFLALSFDPSLVSLIIRAAANAMIYIKKNSGFFGQITKYKLGR
jgi:hypothetical protein